MIRWLTSIVVFTGSVCAQVPAPLPTLVGNKEANEAVTPGTVSPNNIRPKDGGGARQLPDVPPLPGGKVTLLGGTIQNVDHIRNRLILRVFGGGRSVVLFDARTRILVDGKAASPDDLKNGQRAYLDTALDGTSIFARNIRLAVERPTGQSNGQIVTFEPANGELRLRDTLSPEPVKLRLGRDVVILREDRPATTADLRPGTLVALSFAPGAGDTPRVRQISILASPGDAFVFSGRIEHLDVRQGLLGLVDPRDNKSYEVSFDPATLSLTRDLQQGTDVTVHASFNGKRYEARDITVNSESSK